MRMVVIIATIGRRELLPKVLALLEEQSRPPDEVIISAPDESHVAPYVPQRFDLKFVFGKLGSCAQRNIALEQVLGRSDTITFFDDDFLPAASYLARLESAFRKNPDCSLIRGDAVYDGASGPGFSFDEGLKLLRELERDEAVAETEPEIVDHVGGYGCNMSVRAASIGELRFDERLPLYGWQEDIDFSCQLRKGGRVVGINTLRGVHLAAKQGRTSGVRFGYSQVANPVYLVRKGTVPRGFAYKLMVRNFVANLVKSLRPEPYIDRFGRLKGNLLAAYHVLKGRVDPGYILKL